MEQIEIPTYRDLMLPTLIAVQQLGGSAAISELDDTVIATASVTDQQMGVEFPSDASTQGSKVVHRIHWARTYLKMLGALDNSERGIWSITRTGIEYLSMDPRIADEAIRAAQRVMLKERRIAKKEADAALADDDADEADDDEDSNSGTWEEQLLFALKSMDPIAFERLAMRLLREVGFVNLEVTRSSGDEGIDGIGVYKPSLVSFPIYFQCKRYQGTVGPSVVRDFRGAMSGRGEKGLVITTGTFTPSAKKEATRDGAPPVDLIDGAELCSLLRDHKLGVRVVERIVHDVTVDQAFFDSV